MTSTDQKGDAQKILDDMLLAMCETGNAFTELFGKICVEYMFESYEDWIEKLNEPQAIEFTEDLAEQIAQFNLLVDKFENFIKENGELSDKNIKLSVNKAILVLNYIPKVMVDMKPILKLEEETGGTIEVIKKSHDLYDEFMAKARIVAINLNRINPEVHGIS